MQPHLFVKPHDHLDTAHYYEHAFLRDIGQQLIDAGYFSFVDYKLGGQTFENIIVVSGEFYSPAAEKLFLKLISQNIIPREKFFEIARQEICGEELAIVDLSTDTQQIQRRIVTLQEEKWVSANDSPALLSRSRHIPQRHYFKQENFAGFDRLTYQVDIDNSYLAGDPVKLAIYSYASTALSNIFSDELLRRGVHTYLIRDEFRRLKQVARNITQFQQQSIDPDITNAAGYATFDIIQSDEYINRLAHYISGASQRWDYLSLVYTLMRTEGFMLGAASLPVISDPARIRDVISHIHATAPIKTLTIR